MNLHRTAARVLVWSVMSINQAQCWNMAVRSKWPLKNRLIKCKSHSFDHPWKLLMPMTLNFQELHVVSDTIIESVDSNVGIARTRNIWQYIKISPYLKNSELIGLYDNILFIFEYFHDQQDSQWREKTSQKYPTKQQQNGQIVFLLLLSFFLPSDGLAQYCVNLLRWFTHETAAFSTEQCTTPSLFHNFEALQGACSHHMLYYLYSHSLKP